MRVFGEALQGFVQHIDAGREIAEKAARPIRRELVKEALLKGGKGVQINAGQINRQQHDDSETGAVK